MPEFNLKSGDYEIINLIVNILKLVNTTSEARRLITQGAVKIDDNQITDIKYIHTLDNDIVVRVGKKKIIKIIKE